MSQLPTGGTLLHAAAWGGDKEVISYLITKGLPVDARANMPTSFPWSQPWEDVTPLGTAAHFGNVEAIEALLSAGADIDVVSPGAWTPIALAIYGEEIEAVRRFKNLLRERYRGRESK